MFESVSVKPVLYVSVSVKPVLCVSISVKPVLCVSISVKPVLCVSVRKVAPQHAGTAGMMMALFLVIGILSGVNASRLLASLIQVEI